MAVDVSKADLIYKRGDTFPPIKATLKHINQETGAEEAIDLTNALKVTIVLKESAPGASVVVEGLCTGWNGAGIKTSSGLKAGQVEYSWQATDLLPAQTPELYKVEYEIEWPETASVKRIQTVPNGTYRSLGVVDDLGGVA